MNKNARLMQITLVNDDGRFPIEMLKRCIFFVVVRV